MGVRFSTLIDKSYFYFARHGQSIANRSGVIQGHAESPLSPEGKRQAKSLGKWMKKQGVEALYTSPLGRAVETAEIVGRHCRVRAIPHDDVCEIDTGIFSNKTWHEVATHYPAECQRFRVESWEAVPEAENVASLMQRAERYWEHLIEIANGGKRRIATITHGGMLQWLMKVTMGSTTWMPLIPAANCAAFMLYARPESYATVAHTGAGEDESTGSRDIHERKKNKAAIAAAAEGGVADIPISPPAQSGSQADVVRGAYTAWQIVNAIPY